MTPPFGAQATPCCDDYRMTPAVLRAGATVV
ncbi:hypothetical protein FB554_0792 [Barrientosiimonas humi]|uniref:Uncharacterized protein n=1 Tax=Barrientosiimonas humi TaxID=999931 RepID=A0A542XA29_9MICO|nr:hypothetical protein FB554_0792 [Barrientosiimonas humi]CAG7572651.1 hypothetical protein BH39T_PBIAJDOK_01274 [Barrientosiimonas humi]